LPWNIGTTGNMLSRAETVESVGQRHRACTATARPHCTPMRAGDQFLVAQQVGYLAGGTLGRHVCPVGHHDEGLDSIHTRSDRFDQWQKGQIEEQDLVFGVVGDPDHLVRMQARVQRVQHGTRTGHRVVQLHVAVAIPCQRSDAVSELDTAHGQGIGHAAGALGQLAVALAVHVAFNPTRDHLLSAVVALSVHQQVRAAASFARA
jgi:hypothetical protein